MKRGGANVDQNLARNEVLAETIKIASTAILGLSVGRAQCHDHRYDPVTQVDYYRFRALFEPAYDSRNWRTPDERLVSLWPDAVREEAAAVDREIRELEARRSAELETIVAEVFARELERLPSEVQPLAQAARDTTTDRLADAQKQLIKEFPFLKVNRSSVSLYLPDRNRAFNQKWHDPISPVRARRPADDFAHCLTEIPGKVSPTYVFARGDVHEPRQEVAPGELSILNPTGWTILNDDPELPTISV